MKKIIIMTVFTFVCGITSAIFKDLHILPNTSDVLAFMSILLGISTIGTFIFTIYE
jgi:hypothetical protein